MKNCLCYADKEISLVIGISGNYYNYIKVVFVISNDRYTTVLLVM